MMTTSCSGHSALGDHCFCSKEAGPTKSKWMSAPIIAVVYVDWRFTGDELGRFIQPFKTIRKAYKLSVDGSWIIIRG